MNDAVREVKIIDGLMKINVLWGSAPASLALVAMALMKHKYMQSFVGLWMSGLRI